jgi:exopolyphosphatase / guanosine-5'-triphosphate,3'-diphosphate pyrophosphatase
MSEYLNTVRVAVIDFGTNSTRLLVADVANTTVTELDRRTTVTKLGEGVDTTNRISDAAIERVSSVVGEYHHRIDQLGADSTIALATSAARDADNATRLCESLQRCFGLQTRTVTGAEEARLTFLGATSRRDRGAGPFLVVDIGGGSTEFVIGSAGSEPDFYASTQIGSVRHTERYLKTDPPSATELGAMKAEITEIIRREIPSSVRAKVREAIAVAGTATTLAAVDQRLEPYDSSRVDGYTLELGRCEDILDRLAAVEVGERRKVQGLHPDRAPTVVAGAVILVATMQVFDLTRLQASEADILHGAAITAANTPKG